MHPHEKSSTGQIQSGTDKKNSKKRRYCEQNDVHNKRQKTEDKLLPHVKSLGIVALENISGTNMVVPESHPPRNCVKAEGFPSSTTVVSLRKMFQKHEDVITTISLKSKCAIVGFLTANDAKRVCKMMHLSRFPNAHHVLTCKVLDQTLDPLHVITSEEIARLPSGHFPGEVIVISDASQVESAITTLLGKPMKALTPDDAITLGMDTEWKPITSPRRYNTTSLLQFCNGKLCILLRLQKICNSDFTLPNCLVKLLASTQIVKVGLNIIGDAKKLQDDYGVQCNGCEDISKLPIMDRCKPRSLKGLAALFLRLRMDKGSTFTNWEAPVLTKNQIIYAATDAWCSREVFLHMSKLPCDPDS